jgi:Cytochrome bd terminal oxidase subunit I
MPSLSLFHIILVPLGVSWAFMTLIANYRGLRHNDRDALTLAQRWSKYMAVTGIPIPGLASWLSDPSTGNDTAVGA